MDQQPEERVTITFQLPKSLYDRLNARLGAFGEKALFFRAVCERFVNGELEVVIERKL